MQPTHVFMIAAAIFTLSSTSAYSDTTIAFDPFLMRECPQADGSALYTNKDLPGCKLMTLKESVGRALAGQHANLSPQRGRSSSLRYSSIPRPQSDRYDRRGTDHPRLGQRLACQHRLIWVRSS